MDSKIWLWTGWLAAVACLAAAFYALLRLPALEKENRALSLEVAALKAQAGGLQSQVELLEASIQEERERRESAFSGALPPEAGNAAAPGAAPVTAPATAPSLGSLVSGLVKKIDKGGGMRGAMLSMLFEGPQGDRMLDTTAGMTVNMQYGEYINGLNLPPEKKEEVRGLLERYMGKMMRMGLDFMTGGGDPQNLGPEGQAATDEMMRELESLVGAEGMAEFNRYSEQLPERMLEQSLDMQMGFFAAGLSQETRDTVKTVIIEEMLAPPGGAGAEKPATVDAAFEEQRAAFDRALDRLSTMLPPEEYAQAEGFVRQQAGMLDMAAGIMGGGGGAKPSGEK